MNEQNTSKLIADFGEFFCTDNPHRSLMCFGFECGNGWFDIIHTLLRRIKELQPGKSFEITQVKEKFGGLRVYANDMTDEISTLIDWAEGEAFKTCEECGSTNNVDTNGQGWILTLCASCRTARALGAQLK